jgi:hypothetical protein
VDLDAQPLPGRPDAHPHPARAVHQRVRGHLADQQRDGVGVDAGAVDLLVSTAKRRIRATLAGTVSASSS